MSTDTRGLHVDRTEDIWTVRFQPLDFMLFERLEMTQSIFQLLDEVEQTGLKVLRADYSRDSISPTVVDQFWEQASTAPLVAGARGEPPMRETIRNVVSAIPQLLNRVRRLTTLCVASFQGEVDLDLFGVILVAHYRVCSEDTIIVNRVLDRAHGPGSAVFWLLTRYVGYGLASEILLEGKSLTAQEALDLHLINRIVPAEDLESESQSVAEQFAAKPSGALTSLVRASRYLDDDLPTYLKQVGPGFGA